MRLDAAFRIGPSTDTVTINYAAGGDTTVTITAGLYMSAAALATQVQSDLQSQIHASMTCTESDGTFTIAGGSTFTVTWTHLSLRTWLGWDADVTPAVSTTTADNQCPGVFTPTQTWGNEAYGWRWSVKRWAGRHQTGGSIKQAKIGQWEIAALLHAGELAQFRSVIGFLLRGLPATWYRNAADSTAWSYSNWDGKVEVTLDLDAYGDTWLTEPHLREVEVPLRFLEYNDASVTITDFASAIGAPECNVRYYVRIQGIGDLPLSGAIPQGPTGSAWAAPTSQSQNYTYRPHMLDLSEGLSDSGPEISRRTGEVSSGSMSIHLQDNRAADLFALMAREKSDGAVTNMTASLTYTETSTATMESTSDFASSGLAYIGRETIAYTGKTATTLTTLTRGVYGKETGGTSYDNHEYVHNADKPVGTRIVSDYPRVWHGRWVSVYAYVCDVYGRALDAAIDGTYSREIWRGVVKGNPTSVDWLRWTLRCDSIDAITHTEVGRDPIKGTLMRFPGSWEANKDGGSNADAYAAGEVGVYYLSDATRFVDFEVTEYTSEANQKTDTVNAQFSFTGDDRVVLAAAGTILSHADLVSLFGKSLKTRMELESIDKLTITGAKVANAGTHGWNVNLQSDSGYVYRVALFWGVEGSIGNLLGFSGTSEVVVKIYETLFSNTPQGAAAYISAVDTVIPFYYQDTQGIQPDQAAASGFARIGETEIVKYESISDVGDSAKGLFQMNIAERGAMGTTAIEHHVVVDHNTFTSNAESVEVEFGVGWDDAGPITAILEMAVSTAIASHHGTYDQLGRGISPPLNPLHFDETKMAQVEAQLVGPQSVVRLFLSESIKLSELASKLLQPFGMHLVAKHNVDGDYLITVGEVLPPLESEATTTVDTSVLDWQDPAQVEGGNDRVVNQLVVHPIWDPLKGETTDARVTAVDTDSVHVFGEKGKLTWKIMGYQLDPITSVETIHSWAQQIFARFGSPYDLYRVRVDRSGWLISPGDHVLLTLPQAPTVSGTRGFSSDIAQVLQVRHDYEQSGTDGWTGSELIVVVEPYVRTSTYSPSAKVSAYNAGTPSITMDANVFTTAGIDIDSDHFEDGDKVLVFNEGDMGTVSAVTLSNKSGSTFTVSSTLAGGLGVGSYVVPDDYATAQATQRKHAYISDTSTPPVLSVTDTAAFNYI